MTIKNKKIKKKYENALKVLSDLKVSPTLGQLIKCLRECDELPQVFLAGKLEVSRQFLSDVENDRKVVGVEFAKKLAEAMNYPIEMFLQPIINAQLKRAGIKCEVDVISKAS